MVGQLKILHQDDQCIVVSKPPGMFVHRTALNRQETCVVVQTLRDQIGRRVYPVHRLDRATSGVLILALDSQSARWLGKQFQSGAVEKSYWAIVRGWLAHRGHIEHPVANGTKGIRRDALTQWTKIAHWEVLTKVGRYPTARYSLVELSPKTGRRHQLRKHCAHLGNPIVGDVNYGDRHHNRFFKEQLGVTGLMLHASTLRVILPGGQSVCLRDPLERRMREALAKSGRSDLVAVCESRQRVVKPPS